MDQEQLGVKARESWKPSGKDLSMLIDVATLGGERDYGKVGAALLGMYNEYLRCLKKDDKLADYGIFVGYVIGEAISEWVRQPDEKGNTRFDAKSLAEGAASLWFAVGTQGDGTSIRSGFWKEAPNLVIQKLVMTYLDRDYYPGKRLVDEFLEFTGVNVLMGLRDKPIEDPVRVAGNLAKIRDDGIRGPALDFLRKLE